MMSCQKRPNQLFLGWIVPFIYLFNLYESIKSVILVHYFPDHFEQLFSMLQILSLARIANPTKSALYENASAGLYMIYRTISPYSFISSVRQLISKILDCCKFWQMSSGFLICEIKPQTSLPWSDNWANFSKNP